jgi:hypothetical protein
VSISTSMSQPKAGVGCMGLWLTLWPGYNFSISVDLRLKFRIRSIRLENYHLLNKAW